MVSRRPTWSLRAPMVSSKIIGEECKVKKGETPLRRSPYVYPITYIYKPEGLVSGYHAHFKDRRRAAHFVTHNQQGHTAWAVFC